MPKTCNSLLLAEEREKYLDLLAEGNFIAMEKEIYRQLQDIAAQEIQSLVNEFATSQTGYQIASGLRYQHGYGYLRSKTVTITLGQGDQVPVATWYTTKAKKKPGPKKKGPNGRGCHLLLGYWGFNGKYSPTYVSRITRSGTASMSYDLAAKDLQQQGFKLVAKTIDNLVQKVGNQALEQRSILMTTPDEDWTGKRIMIAIDGGRVRTRQAKRGRYRQGQKRTRYQTNWREPKMIVVAELNEQGRKKKGTSPLYEATLGNADQVYQLLVELTQHCHLHQAQEIILVGDGADWIWERYCRWQRHFKVTSKTTQILDWYHAVEHLTTLTQAHLKLTEEERKLWFRKLKKLLRGGQYRELKREVSRQAKEHHLPKLKQHLTYFEKHKERIDYFTYEQRYQPIGSGLVESAIRRVINLKLKSPSIFWKVDNLERILHLRCILMANRWQTFIDNLMTANRLTLAAEIVN